MNKQELINSLSPEELEIYQAYLEDQRVQKQQLIDNLNDNDRAIYDEYVNDQERIFEQSTAGSLPEIAEVDAKDLFGDDSYYDFGEFLGNHPNFFYVDPTNFGIALSQTFGSDEEAAKAFKREFGDEFEISYTPIGEGETFLSEKPRVGDYQTNLKSNTTGKMVVLNRPGFSMQDAITLSGNIGTFAAGPVVKGSLGVRAMGQGLRDAGKQAAIEIGQTTGGGEFNPENVALAGVAGLGGEVISQVGKNAIKKFMSPKKMPSETQVEQQIDQSTASANLARWRMQQINDQVEDNATKQMRSGSMVDKGKDHIMDRAKDVGIGMAADAMGLGGLGAATMMGLRQAAQKLKSPKSKSDVEDFIKLWKEGGEGQAGIAHAKRFYPQSSKTYKLFEKALKKAQKSASKEKEAIIKQQRAEFDSIIDPFIDPRNFDPKVKAATNKRIDVLGNRFDKATRIGKGVLINDQSK